MLDNRLSSVQSCLLAGLIFLLTASFLPSPGTADVPIWQTWMGTASEQGVIGGFQANQADYPPFTVVILRGASGAGRLLGLDSFGTIKVSIFAFLFLTTFVTWLWTRNGWIAAIVHLSLLINSVAMGFLDVFFAPSLILALWALRENRVVLFSICYAVACLTKWQPLIIAPFLGIHILRTGSVGGILQKGRLLTRATGPAFLLIALTVYAFGATHMLESVRRAVSHDFLSGNALNFPWVVTHWLRAFRPERFGGLGDGLGGMIQTVAPDVTLLPRILFLFSYVTVWITFLRRERSFENTIGFALTGYLAYFTFNTGVHDNHLFIAVILSIVLFWMNGRWLVAMLSLVLMNDVNLVLFYGLTGKETGFRRALVGGVDVALWFSVLNVCFFVVVWRFASQLSLPRGAAD